ncbi:MAG TPA: M24 family metallopeptidase [Clostridia bacterium]|nr:M24 family metallopeptidase [Clostridia bacterium]
MIEFITDLQETSRLLNTAVKNKFLSVALNYDGYRSVAPVIAKKDGRNILITRHIERGNVEALQKIDKAIPPDYQVVYYNPYFTFEPSEIAVYEDFISAVDGIAGQEGVASVHQDMPLSMYQSLAKKYDCVLAEKTVADPRFYLYTVSQAAVLEKFNQKRDQADQAALKLIENSPVKKELTAYIKNRVDTRFVLLDKLLQTNGLEAVLCTSPLGVQEITGYGITRHQEDRVAALYIKGSANVYLFSVLPLEDYGPGQQVDSFAAMVKNLVSDGPLGLEEQHFPIGWLTGLGFAELNWKNAMNMVRQLRELRAAEDLSYCIIAARISVFATDESLEWGKKEILAGRKISELDIYNKYQFLLQVFKERHNLPLKINTFWTNCHAAGRSVIPSLPFDYPLDQSCKAVKIDAGVSLIGDTGIHHAASDIARTIIFDGDVQKAYDRFESYMVKDVIPNVKAGMCGKDIYELAVSRVEKERPYFLSLGMIPDADLARVFNRDVGHNMGLQEPVTIFFKKDTAAAVTEGMVGALEYQWSMKNFGIGVEDLFLIGPDGGLNFSRDQL